MVHLLALDTSKPRLDAFLKEHPYIKAELVRLGEEQLVNRIMSETRASRFAFDVLSATIGSARCKPSGVRRRPPSACSSSPNRSRSGAAATASPPSWSAPAKYRPPGRIISKSSE